MTAAGRKQLNKLLQAVLIAAVLIAAGLYLAPCVYAADSGLPEGYVSNVSGLQHTKMRDIFTTETIDVQDIRVVEVQKNENGNILTNADGSYRTEDLKEPAGFRIFNTTTQEDEFGSLVKTVKDADGHYYLRGLKLKKDHDYIFFAEDKNYRYPKGAAYPSASKAYVQVRVRPNDSQDVPDDPGAYNYLVRSTTYNKLEEIVLERRDVPCSDPFKENRYKTSNDDQPKLTVVYKGNPRAGIHFKLVSDVETLDVTSGSGGVFDTSLIEGVTYMVYVDSDRYSIDPFPIVAKDKTEYGEGLYCYNHSTCIRVENITLYDKGDTVFDGLSRNTVKTSLKKRSTVTGINFKNLLIIDRVLDDKVDALAGKDYEVVSFNAVNETRWELSKLKGTDFGITWKKCGGKLVRHVYIVDGDKLKEVAFKQSSGNDVNFTMDSLSLYPVAIEYDPDTTYAEKVAADKAAREEAARKAKEAEWKGVTDKKLPVPKISKPKAAKKSATVKWKKLSKKQLKTAGGIKIEVQYSYNKNFPMDQTKSKFLSKKKASIKIKSLKSKKTCYMRVRTYKKAGGVKKVSRWSKVKKVKVK